ncbi:MAG: hypothetical protein Tsb002_05820 [Wenzhouxiangellaceae bacterium]
MVLLVWAALIAIPVGLLIFLYRLLIRPMLRHIGGQAKALTHAVDDGETVTAEVIAVMKHPDFASRRYIRYRYQTLAGEVYEGEMGDNRLSRGDTLAVTYSPTCPQRSFPVTVVDKARQARRRPS